MGGLPGVKHNVYYAQSLTPGNAGKGKKVCWNRSNMTSLISDLEKNLGPVGNLLVSHMIIKFTYA